MPEMQVVAVGVDPDSHPLLILRESEGQRRILPVWMPLVRTSGSIWVMWCLRELL